MKLNCRLVLVLFLSALLCAPLGAAVSKEVREAIGQALDDALEHRDFQTALVGILVEEADSGQVVYSRNAELSMIPASNQKVFTTAAALELLGPDYVYRTRLVRTGEVENGVLKGHLIAVGSGDPTISGRYRDGDVTAILREWVQAVKEAGIHRVEGYLVGDDDLWNDDEYAGGWDHSYIGAWYAAPSSALSFNDNCVDIIWRPGSAPGQPASYTLEPDTEYLTLINRVTTRPRNSGAARYYRRRMYSSTVEMTGGLDLNRSGARGYIAVNHPTLYFVTVLAELLEREGIEVQRGPIDIDDFPEKRSLRRGRVEIASYTSPPMSEICQVINQRSQNFFAEQVLRTLGEQKGSEGGYRAGARVVQDFLKDKNVSTAGFRMRDGSGLSWSNRTSPKTLVELFRAMQDNEAFVESLPVGGERGSLQSRFTETNTMRRIRGKVRAKSGYIYLTWTLSGYLETESGDNLLISVMLNNHTGAVPRTWIDRLFTIVATEGKGWK